VMRLRDGATRRLYEAVRRSGTLAPDTSGDLGDFFKGRRPC